MAGGHKGAGAILPQSDDTVITRMGKEEIAPIIDGDAQGGLERIGQLLQLCGSALHSG